LAPFVQGNEKEYKDMNKKMKRNKRKKLNKEA
jgi:hypothetical protein